MKFATFTVFSLTSAFVAITTACKPSPKVAPKLEYDFSINLVLSPSISAGTVDIYNGQLTYLSISGGTFCAKWNGGVSGAVVPGGSATYLQVANGTGPYKLEFEYLLKTNEKTPAYILVKQKGWEVNFIGRTTYVLESGDERYEAVNTAVWVGVETGYIVNATGTYSSVDGYSISA